MALEFKAQETQTLTIANGQTVSDVLDARFYDLFGLVIPAAFTGATISFQVSADAVTYQDLYDTANTKVTITVAVSRSYDLGTTLKSWPYWKVVSASAEGGARSIVVTKKG